MILFARCPENRRPGWLPHCSHWVEISSGSPPTPHNIYDSQPHATISQGRCQDLLCFLLHHGDVEKEHLSITFCGGWWEGRMPGITSPSLSLPAIEGTQNLLQLLWTVHRRRKSNVIFAVRNAQGEKCSWHSYTGTRDTFPYKNHNSAFSKMNKHYVEKREEWAVVREAWNCLVTSIQHFFST